MIRSQKAKEFLESDKSFTNTNKILEDATKLVELAEEEMIEKARRLLLEIIRTYTPEMFCCKHCKYFFKGIIEMQCVKNGEYCTQENDFCGKIEPIFLKEFINILNQ